MTQPPIPTLPREAGGPRPRPAGPHSRAFPAALAFAGDGGAGRRATVEEHDPLVASAVRAAVTGLGYVVDGQACPVLSFVGLGGLEAVASCCLRRRPAGAADLLVVGYTLRAPLAAALHRAHGCADAVLVLDTAAGGPRFRHLCWPDVLARAGLTCREADVLALLLTRRTNAEIARQLVVADATVRAHCRSVLRKLEVPHRRALWSRAEAEWSTIGLSEGLPDFCR